MSNKLKKDVIDLSKFSRDELEEDYLKLYMRCAQAEAKADRFLEKFKIAQQKRFGKSSEKNITGQMSLNDFNFFNEAEASASKACEKNDKGTFVTAPGAPKELFKNSPASPSVFADSITKKYSLALPFDRIAKDYEQKGIPISKGNMCKWSIMAAENHLTPIVEVMKNTLMEEDAIHCDATFSRVVNQDDNKASSKPYIWVITTAEYQKDHPIAIYNYRPGRSDPDCREVLGDYSGYVMCDAYTCYDSVHHTNKETGAPPLNIKPVACMVHVKRGEEIFAMVTIQNIL